MDNNTQKRYEELCVDILAKAKRQGATSAEVTIDIDAGFSVTSRLGQVETVEHHQDKGMGLTVYFGQQTGSASSSDLSPDALDTIILKACSIAKFTNEDPYAGIAEQNFMAYNYPQLALDFPWAVSTEEALGLAIDCEKLAMSDARITNSEGASVSSHRSLHVFANTHDFVGSYISTQHSMNCVLIAQKDGQMQRDFEYTVARDANELKHINELAKAASDRTLNRLGARRLTTRQAPVIFLAPLAKGLLSHLVKAISGGNIYRKSSFLLDHLNQQVLPTNISLTQDPHLPKAIGSTPFDHEGVRTIKQDFVTNGILQKYILSSYSARKLGMQTTGNAGGVFNLQITQNDLSFDALLKQMDTGLLVTELMGQGINLVNGDYSRGAFGYWVENGQIQYPVEEITIASNLKNMLLGIAAVANDVDKRSNIHTGSILLENMMIAGE